MDMLFRTFANRGLHLALPLALAVTWCVTVSENTGAAAPSLPYIEAPAQVSTNQDTNKHPKGVTAVARPKQDLALAFTLPARVSQVLVKPGEVVKEGQILVHLDDSELKSQIELLKLRAASDLEERAAKAEWDMAKVEQQKWEEMRLQGAANELQLRKAVLETERSRLAYELFVQRRKEAELQLKEAEIRAKQYTLVSPIAGVVDDVIVEVGETVEPGRPVARVVETSVLRIDATVPTSDTLTLKVGGSSWILINLDQPVMLEGKINHIAAVADSGSQTRVVRVEATNQQQLPGGVSCEVFFTKPQLAAATK